MILLGTALSGSGLPFLSAEARHGRDGSRGEVVCETQEQCDAIAAWAAREGWTITTRVATAEEEVDTTNQAMHDSNSAPTPSDPPKPVRKIAWCPDDCDDTEAREYTGETVREIAEQHAEHLYYGGLRHDCYDIRVRATKGDQVREWDVTVDVEVEVSFSAALAFPVKPKAPTRTSETLP